MIKPVFGSSEQLQHKLACTVTEADKKLEISDLRRRRSENKGTDQLRSYCEADLRLCFRIGNLVFSRCGPNDMGLKFDICIE